jgi:hypothetical protein
VSTGAARCQDVSLNPQKLAGQCAKLKCCLNYETAVYTEALQKLPQRNINLETKDTTYYYFKADILAGLVSYSTDKHFAANVVTITSERASEVIKLNQQGEKPDSLLDETMVAAQKPEIVDLAEQDSLTRFDKSKRKRKKNKRNDNKPQNAEAGNAKRDNAAKKEGAGKRDEATKRDGANAKPNQRDKAQATERPDESRAQSADGQRQGEPRQGERQGEQRPNNRRRNSRHRRPNRNENAQE